MSNQAIITANCAHCGRIIDTREEKDGGDSFGCELDDGRWACSPECYDILTIGEIYPIVTGAMVEAALDKWFGDSQWREVFANHPVREFMREALKAALIKRGF